ncbi:MAG: lipoprotein LipL21 [Leptospiraceae bacterium]|nr:lipoprotein LipL21 [Leptospiraceae bacterium]MCP5493540.1 lipoprotein LipL21 [Leptospiraceae bacterium]
MNYKLSLTLLLSISLIITFSYCSSTPGPTTVGKGGEQFEGWAGPPEDLDAKPKDYFYMKYAGRASENAINKDNGAGKKKGSGPMMQTTCRDAAELNAKGDIIQKLAKETVQGASGVTDGESTGKLVVREFNAYVSGMNVKECKPLAVEDPDVPYSKWKECECVMFVRVPGGREAVLAKVKDIGGK